MDVESAGGNDFEEEEEEFEYIDDEGGLGSRRSDINLPGL